MSYHLLQRAAHKLTEHFVIEAGVDTEGVVNAELPAELLAVLQQSLGDFDLDDTSNSRNQKVSGYLLAWMITFDLFVDAVSNFTHVLKATRLTSDVVTES